MILPMATVSVIAAPVSPAKNTETETLTWESAPRTRPKRALLKVISFWVSPPWFISSAVKMK